LTGWQGQWRVGGSGGGSGDGDGKRGQTLTGKGREPATTMTTAGEGGR